ncbi:MAG: NAD(P)-binding domain-containing protein [Bacteroidales bacterium]|nr:NAD(P)-binding domain-containing protein [Bacteroidales bacterium]
MNANQEQITFIGAGAIGTALGNILSSKPEYRVILHSIDDEAVHAITFNHQNPKYFPSIQLNRELKATTNNQVIRDSSVLFLAIPSVYIIEYLESIRSFIPEKAILVNLAKGFGTEHKTICECLQQQFPNPVCTMKGPTFAREIITLLPTGFTLGYSDESQVNTFRNMFLNTSIYLDYTADITGVEILSILKNIYAIVLGIIDAQFNSPNLRFLILTKAFREMRRILLHFGGSETTLFNYCGYGDFTLTALNDLSRNRTLGLLIGKGFFTEHVSHELVLEGKTAVNIFYEELSKKLVVGDHFPIVAELYKIFNNSYDISSFVNAILALKES